MSADFDIPDQADPARQLDAPEGPEISVVVAAFSGGAALRRCLECLQAQTAPAEIMVATGAGKEAVASWAASFPGVCFVSGEPGASVFELRALGVARARGRLVVLTEDHCSMGPEWLAVLRAACDDRHPVVGGPVDNGLDRGGYDWALYFCEYGRYMPPLPAGPAATLSGVNAAYRRDLLQSCRSVWQAEFRENQVHDALHAAGHRLHIAGDAGVKSHLPFAFLQAMSHLAEGGFRYGAYRTRHSPATIRILRAMAAPVVPLVLLARIAGCVAGRQPRRLWSLCRAMPYLLCLLAAWSVAEALGGLRSPIPGAAGAGPWTGGQGGAKPKAGDVLIGIDACCWSNRRGYGRYTRELVTPIVAGGREHEFTLFVDAQTAGDCQLPAGVRVEVMTTSRQPTQAASAGGFRSPLDLWRMHRAVARFRCDVFFFPASYSFFPIPRRIPTVITVHDAIPETHPRLTFPGWRSRFLWAIKTRMALRQADRLLTVSHQAKAVIARTLGYPASAIEVVPEAPGSRFRVLNEPAGWRGVREHYRLPQEAPLLLYVGGISPHKNLHGLLHALAPLRRGSPNPWHLVLVGDHQTDSFLGCYGELQRLCRSLDLNGRVTFTGFVPDDHLVALYNTATLLVLPSFDEGFGLPAVEAMACGLPVVASSRGSLPEVIGSAGEFVDPDNHDQMGAVIGGLLDDPRRRGELRSRGLERAAGFSWAAAARQTIRVLEETARAAAGNA